MIKIPCPYCGKPVSMALGKDIYPHRKDLASRRYVVCWPCKAWTGLREGDKPAGRLANAELRMARAAAHLAFNPLWKDGVMSRNGAYRWLSEQLGIPKALCHIGDFDVAGCTAVIEAAKRRNG